jgi:hypothetical protein
VDQRCKKLRGKTSGNIRNSKTHQYSDCVSRFFEQSIFVLFGAILTAVFDDPVCNPSKIIPGLY